MKLIKNTSNLIKNEDLFGYKVNIHFGTFLNKDEQGDATYKTFFGGLVSIACKAFLLYYIYYYFMLMIDNSFNTNYFIE
jgi:hypothetical protein